MKTRVLEVIWALNYGGVEQVCLQILNNLDKDSFQVDFAVCWDKTVKGELEDVVRSKGAKIYKLTHVDNRATKKQYLLELSLLLKSNKYDCVHAHQAFLNTSVLRLAKKHGVKVRVSHVHVLGRAMNPWVLWLKQILLNKYATCKLASSLESAKYHYGENADYLIYHNAIDVALFAEQRQRKRPEYSFVTVCRMCNDKNPYLIMDIMKKLGSKSPEYELDWIGEGHMMDDIVEYAKKNEIRNVRFLGSKGDVAEELAKHKYFLLPSKREGFGISALEAQAAGTFCFLSDGFPEEIDMGFMLKIKLNKDADTWAEIIDDFVRLNKIKKFSPDDNRIRMYDARTNVDMIARIYKGNCLSIK